MYGCMGEYTYGLVGASKILFAVLPEVAQPIDNSQWLNVFRTIDYGDIIMAMAAERRIRRCQAYTVDNKAICTTEV
jgi:hypothetical protein